MYRLQSYIGDLYTIRRGNRTTMSALCQPQHVTEMAKARLGSSGEDPAEDTSIGMSNLRMALADMPVHLECLPS